MHMYKILYSARDLTYILTVSTKAIVAFLSLRVQDFKGAFGSLEWGKFVDERLWSHTCLGVQLESHSQFLRSAPQVIALVDLTCTSDRYCRQYLVLNIRNRSIDRS